MEYEVRQLAELKKQLLRTVDHVCRQCPLAFECLDTGKLCGLVEWINNAKLEKDLGRV